MPGQAYVALCVRSLEGLILLSPLRMNGISNDQDVMDYALNKASEELLIPCIWNQNFIHNYLINSFDWHDLAQEWRNHKFSYGDKTENTTNQNMPIGLQNNWMLSKAFWTHPKFIHQLNKIFARETVDLIHVSDRIKLRLLF
jgi:hypothetical protein